MIRFFILLILLAAVLEIFSIRDALRHVDFSYGPKEKKTEPEEPFPVEIRMANTGILPITYLRALVLFSDSMHFPGNAEKDLWDCTYLTHEERYFLWGRQRKIRTIQVTCPVRGVFHFPGARLERGDFLGLREMDGNADCDGKIVVYPPRFNEEWLSEAMGHFIGDMSAKQYLLRDPVLTIGTREYPGSEPMHTIHWLKSAQRGELMVREFDHTRDLSCAVILAVTTIRPQEYYLIDRCASIVRSVAEMLAAEHIAIRVYTNAYLHGFRDAAGGDAGGGFGNLEGILEFLARVDTASAESVPDIAREAAMRGGEGTAYLVVAPHRVRQIDEAVRILDGISGLPCGLITADQYDTPGGDGRSGDPESIQPAGRKESGKIGAAGRDGSGKSGAAGREAGV